MSIPRRGRLFLLQSKHTERKIRRPRERTVPTASSPLGLYRIIRLPSDTLGAAWRRVGGLCGELVGVSVLIYDGR